MRKPARSSSGVLSVFSVGGCQDRVAVPLLTSGDTLTWTWRLTVPPAPLHSRVKLLSAIRPLTVSLPVTDLLPLQSPLAVQLSASLLLQLRVTEPL